MRLRVTKSYGSIFLACPMRTLRTSHSLSCGIARRLQRNVMRNSAAVRRRPLPKIQRNASCNAHAGPNVPRHSPLRMHQGTHHQAKNQM